MYWEYSKQSRDIQNGYWLSINIKINLFLYISSKQLENEILDFVFNSIKNLKYMLINLMKDVQGFFIDKYKMVLR